MEQITIKEIAKMCGVGVSTVSRAINNHPDISDETRRKVLDVIQKYNYIPNNSAQNLKRSASDTIAVLIKGISNPFFSDMIQVFEEETRRKEYCFILQHVEESEDEVDVAIRIEKEKRLKGIVFLGGITNRPDEKLNQLNVPFVFSSADMADTDGKYSSVSIDHVKESRKMVDYLCDCGHKKIALLTARKSDSSVGFQRYKGYRESLEAHGIEYDEGLVEWTPDDMMTYSMAAGYKLTNDLLDSGKEFTCIFAASDRMATGACKALFNAGWHIPEDCSVAGFDGLGYATYYEPSITTINQPRKEIAEATISLLFDLINKKQTEKRIVLDAELVIGKSTAAPCS
ncbi:MAG: LacI family transcriptional regulator [Lachnospiraceae bacterium]|nr:LacI family transcriptional regulator [Lachnospiraceae bacterium]